ncbi:MAG TPA: NAD-dependent epimerase/dehydratase family protein [Gemmataceae bacterium]|nr:NAD-dependent epimerase/dehydratase family protein [Gemmataceae bacterium]
MKAKVLVTGGAGFLGSHVTDALIMDYEVVVLDDLSGGFVDNVHPNATFIQGTILDHELIDRLFREHKFRQVFHLAAYAAEGLSHFIKRFNYENNLIGSVNLINASVNHGVDSFVFTSSIAVYGANQLPMHEDLIPQPEDSYGIAKLAVEQELKASHHMFGLNYVIFRPHNVYGERQNLGDPYRNVIGIFMNQIMQGLPVTVFGDGKQTRAFTHIQDIAPVIASAGANKAAFGQVFNVGADVPYSVNQLVDCVGDAMGTRPQIKYEEARKEVMHAYSSHEKVRRYFQCPADTSLTAGLKQMAAWASQAGVRKGKPFSGIEIERGLPASWRRIVR